jgi:Raffinose synthase or seed imbibition protein Sip1
VGASRNGLVVLESYSGTPDSAGVLETYRLNVPKFTRGIYYRGQWWPYAGNRVAGNIITTPEGREGGIFLLLALADGGYLAVLPLCGDQAYAWLAPRDDRFYLKLGTHGPAAIHGDMPLVSWARTDSPYEACRRSWMQACECRQIKGWMKPRQQKIYPELFKYLGWCSWEGYHKNISSDKLAKEFEGLRASPVPIRYFLVDDGHYSTNSLAPDPDKFPQGYKPLTERRSANGIRWVGTWYALLGNASAMPEGQPEKIKDSMMLAHNGRMVPKPDRKSIETFLRYMTGFSRRDGIDFLKVDFCGTLLPVYAGTKQRMPLGPFPTTTAHAIANPSRATALFARLYQTVVAEEFKGLINCNWHVPHFLFNSGDSVVGRCSEDYALGNLKRAKAHLYHSYSAMPWLGQIAWGDHDMFHSSDKVAGRMMAVSKAVSGGPVYLSDRYTELVPDRVRPLCYEDGLLLRPLAPASPLPADLFKTMDEDSLYRVMAPLANKAVAFVLYNLRGDIETNQVELSGEISAEDYRSASALMQPYPGKWDIPAGGLLVYDHHSRRAEKLNQSYRVSIRGFGDRLLQVSPILHGWSVIGRTDKYLSAAAVDILSCTDTQLKVRLHEAGPFAVWLEAGVPKAPGCKFVERGNGLYESVTGMKRIPAVITMERG